MNPLTQSKNATILPVLIALTLGCLGLSPQARAVDPPPGGDYPGFNTALGFNALFNLDTTRGISNTALGHNALSTSIDGDNNTATGLNALRLNTTGSSNTATGVEALLNNTTGNNNTASGVSALATNSIGSNNTAVGQEALVYNTVGNDNTATGVGALRGDSTVGHTGSANTASGHNALYSNKTGSFNTVSGDSALYTNTTGGFNVASGRFALFSNTTGSSNTAIGYDSLYSNQNGMNNTATGVETLVRNTTGSSNTALGFFALINNTTGNNNIALGEHAGSNLTTGSDNINIGNFGKVGESNKIRIGTTGVQKATFIAGIRGVTVASGVGVIVGTDGKLGTVVSSARFKDQIRPMDKASEAILALKPVTFNYKKELVPDGTPQFGLIAEEVAKVNPDLVVRDEEGKPYTVRYEAVNAMLLNEFLKEHRKGLEQDESIAQLESAVAKHEATIAQQQKDFRSTIAQQQKEIEALTASLKKQASQIQKVSELFAAANPSIGGLEARKSSPQLVVNNQ